MAWIRLSDNYIDHPKIEPLSDGAFRLWHQMLAYCRRHLTDGLVPKATMLGFASYKPKRLDELLQPAREGYIPLVEKVQSFGFKMHDYLEWNPSKDEETERRSDSRDRMRALRERRLAKGVTPCDAVTNSERDSHVLDMDTDRKLLEREMERPIQRPVVRGAVRELPPLPDEAISSRAAWLLNGYREWFSELRRGARYHARPHLDFPKAVDLVQTWPDDGHLEKLARIVLTTDDDWISRTDRGFAVFAAKATWADDRYREWEANQGKAS